MIGMYVQAVDTSSFLISINHIKITKEIIKFKSNLHGIHYSLIYKENLTEKILGSRYLPYTWSIACKCIGTCKTGYKFK